MKKICILISVLAVCFSMYAQNAVTSSGGEAVGNAGSVSYSIGQPFVSYNEGTSGQTNEGVHQPYEIYDVTESPDVISDLISLSAFPNPTSDYLTLRIDGDLIEGFTGSMYDVSGREIMRRQITSTETTFDVSHLPPATYFLRVTNGKDEVKTFKVVKK